LISPIKISTAAYTPSSPACENADAPAALLLLLLLLLLNLL
jgi:hypothetical protein